MNASASGAIAAASSSGAIAATGALDAYSPTILPMAPAEPFAPMRPRASATRPRTSGRGSLSSGASADSAVASPMSPSEKAAIILTSGSVSASAGVSIATPSLERTRPIASAARRRTCASPSRTRIDKSGKDDGGGGVTIGSGFFPLTGGGGGGGAGRSMRSSRWSSSLEDPRHLLLLGNLWRLGQLRRRRRHARRCQNERHGNGRLDDGAAYRLPHMNVCRHARNSMVCSVAAATREATTCTPVPGPSGTAMVPSGLTTISGSIKSGA